MDVVTMIGKENLQKQKVVGTVTRLLTFSSKLVSKGDQSDGGDGVPVAAVVTERDIHGACPIKDFFREVPEFCFAAKLCGEPLEVFLADHRDDV